MISLKGQVSFDLGQQHCLCFHMGNAYNTGNMDSKGILVIFGKVVRLGLVTKNRSMQTLIEASFLIVSVVIPL